MSSQTDCKTRLLKLQQHIPFLQKMLRQMPTARDGSLADQRQKMNALLTYITNTCDQLRPEILDRCEEFLRNIIQNFEEVEWDAKGGKPGADHAVRFDPRQPTVHHGMRENHWMDTNQGNRSSKMNCNSGEPSNSAVDDETPRSPSPEETNRLSSSYVPISIPVNDFRSDTDHRIVPSFHHGDTGRDGFHGRGSMSRGPQSPHGHVHRSLRTEPIEIPLGHSSGDLLASEDRDYRHVFDRTSLESRPTETRTVSYRSESHSQPHGFTELSPAAPSNRLNESRFNSPFDRDHREFTEMAGPASMPQQGSWVKDRPHFSSFGSNRDWKPFGPDRDRRSEDLQRLDDGRRGAPPRDVDFRSSPNQRWSHEPPRPKTGLYDDVWESFSVKSSHQSPFIQPDWNRGHDRPNTGGNTGDWSPGDSSSRRADRDFSSSGSSAGRGHGFRTDDRNQYGRNYEPYRSGSRFSYASQPQPNPYNRPAPSGPQAAPSRPNLPTPPRREDPRLASRNKVVSPATPQSADSEVASTTSVQPSNSKEPRPSDPTARTSDPKPRAPEISPRAPDSNLRPSDPTPQSSFCGKPTGIKAGGSDQKNATKTTKEKEFTSPLDSLYSHSVPGQTGRGYGTQTYRIPKKKKPEVKVQVPRNETDPAAVKTSEELVESAKCDADPPEGKATAAVPVVEETKKEEDAVTQISMAQIQSYLKTVLPEDVSQQVLKQLEKAKESDKLKGKSSRTVHDSDSEEGNRPLVVDESPKEPQSTADPADGSVSGSVRTDTESATEIQSGMEENPTESDGSAKKRKRKKNSTSSLEVARLHEDLVDYMPYLGELPTRRSRLRTQRVVQEPPESSPNKRRSKRNRKSEVTSSDEPEIPSSDPGLVPVETQAEPVEESAEGSAEESMERPAEDSVKGSVVQVEEGTEGPTEGSTTELTPPPEPSRGKRKKRGRNQTGRPKTRAAPAPGTAKKNETKKKKTFAPTRLSLRGKRSMYENVELSDVVGGSCEGPPGSSDQYFKCKDCEFFGQKIIHHYVNEHSSVEIPFATVPETLWPAVLEQDPAAVAIHQVDAVLLSDTSWIPSKHSVASPVSCKHCTFTSCLRSEILEHAMSHALPGQCRYRCFLCGFEEGHFFDMLDHVTGHSGEYRYQCNYCNYRVSRRISIKQHMKNLHESQDVLFYNVILPDANRLWVDGYVCRTCRYFQIKEDGLKRHSATGHCDGQYIKISLISLVPSEEHQAGTFVPSQSSESAPVPVNPEGMGIFICPSLEAACPEPGIRTKDVDQLADTLRRSVTYIKILAEKLTQEPQEDSPASSVDVPGQESSIGIPQRDSESNGMEEISPQAQGQEESAGTCVPVDTAISVVESPSREEQVNVEQVDPSILLEAWRKSNPLLATTISKLADKLGGNVSENASPRSASPVAESRDSVVTLDEGELADSSSSSMDEEDLEEEEESVEEGDSSEGSSIVDHLDGTVEPAWTEPAEDFLPKIENVVSLKPVELEDDLDPVRTVLPFSTVVMARDECTFPYRLAHDRCGFAAQLKKKNMYRKMLDVRRICDFFKCMAHHCMFSSDSAADFQAHLDWHRKEFLVLQLTQNVPEYRTPILKEQEEGIDTRSFQDFGLCSYCPLGFHSSDELVDHLRNHAESVFQCSACFFRARSSQVVQLHIRTAHSDQNQARPLPCGVVFGDQQPTVPFREVSMSDLPRLKCPAERCSFECFFVGNFLEHLDRSHPGQTDLTCPECRAPISGSTDDRGHLWSHFSSHATGCFQCAWCSWASHKVDDAVRHLCLTHPSVRGKVYVRIPPTGTTCTRTLLHFPTPPSEGSDQVRSGDLSAELYDSIDVVDPGLTMEEDAAVASGSIPNSVPDELRGTVGDKQVPESDAEFYGFGEEERARAREQSESLMAEADSEIDGDQDPETPTAPVQVNEEADVSIEDDGLSGHDLYKCGNVGCDYTAATSNELKDHLFVCDLARDSRLLMCHHCGRSMKAVSNLLEHLKVHGPKCYSCGLCGHKGPVAISVRKHMKTAHKCGMVDMLPVKVGSTNANSGKYTLYPKDMAKKLLESRRARSGLAASKQKYIYSYEDIHKIPMRSILSFAVECGHCDYSTKVRANMVRHLSLHEKNAERAGSSSDREELVPRVVVPDLAPVNPVPHLEGKEKMFDKMTNLAYSSHAIDGVPAPGRMGTSGRMGSNSIVSDKVAEEDVSAHLIFVPDHQRYVCGFEGCSHLTSSENLLKYHLQALHKNATFSCPHCPAGTAEASALALEPFRSHLKLHGPRLYRCGHCPFHHWQPLEIEKHVTEKHPNRPPWQIVVREPKDVEVRSGGRSQSGKACGDSGGLPWHCAMCKHASASCTEILIHVQNSHGIKSQFKCALCSVRSNVRSEFERHFASRHPDHEVQVLTMFYRLDETEKKNSPESVARPVAAKPLWKKNEPRLRHIRGILLEDENTAVSGSEEDVDDLEDPVYGPYGTPSNGLLCCPICKTYCVAYARDFKDHLYRELQYKKFLCSKCSVGGPSRLQVMRHAEKQHAKDGAFIREIAPNQALEDWVEKVVKIQIGILKKSKSGLAKNKKNPVAASPAKAAASTSTTTNPKAKKSVPVVQIVQATSVAPTIKEEVVDTIHVELEPMESTSGVSRVEFSCSNCSFTTVSLASFRKHEASHKEESGFPCCYQQCSFQAPTAALLEGHVATNHHGPLVCRQCGHLATDKTSLLTHWKKSGHPKFSESGHVPEGATDRLSCDEAPNSPTKSNKKSRSKTVLMTFPYRCKYCNFRGASENGINLHWQRCHSADKKPLDFEYEPQPGMEVGTKINYRCQHCGVQGQFEELKKHSERIHPHQEASIVRLTGKRRPTETVDLTADEPPAKKTVEENSPKPSTSGESKAGRSAVPTSPGVEVVFVVAQSQAQYVCNWCQARFSTENEIIRHHVHHPSSSVIRYTKVESCERSGGQPVSETRRTLLEIRFECPVCKKLFESLQAARSHVLDHNQAWKCGHCVQLFATPTGTLQHIKEAHPGLPGRVESIDSPSLVADKLTKGISMHRVQLNTKFLKDKPIPNLIDIKDLGQDSASTSGTSSVRSETKEASSTSSVPVRPHAAARKSASVSLLYCKEEY